MNITLSDRINPYIYHDQLFQTADLVKCVGSSAYY